MCGINGIIQFKRALSSEDLELRVRRMNDRLSHRGPDDQGTHNYNGICIGQRRLSIIDLSSGGHQPMLSYDGRYVIVFNGEIYNFKEIRTELERVARGSESTSYPFKTQSDTEVILAAFLRWGKDCVTWFNGMFAFVIHDLHTQEIFIARDRLGIKPFYYVSTDSFFCFSSEIRALISCGLFEAKVNQDGLWDYFRYQTVHAPSTILKDVLMLMPGHRMFIDKNGKVTDDTYWELNQFKARNKTTDIRQVHEEIRTLFRDAVRRRLVADVPFGAFLSGGIDSSAVVGMMAETAHSEVRTFSVVFDDPEFSEARYAKLVAEKFGTKHTEIHLSPDDFRHALPDALKAMDHPSGDGPNTYVVSKVTRASGVTMALSGLGGDELFAGYDVFRRMFKAKQLAALNIIPSSLRTLPFQLLKQIRPGVAAEKMLEFTGQAELSFEAFYAQSRKVLSDREIAGFYKASIPASNAVYQICKSLRTDDGGVINHTGKSEIATYMQNTLLRDTDQMSMAHALEVRVPFLDYKLVEYVYQLPDVVKYPHYPKKLLVESLGDLLPGEIVHRPKMGFTLPWKKWMKNELKSFCEERMMSLASRAGFDKAATEALWRRFLQDDPTITWSRIWYLVVLENWLIDNGIDAN